MSDEEYYNEMDEKERIQELFGDVQREDQDIEDQQNEVDYDLDYTEAGFDYYPF